MQLINSIPGKWKLTIKKSRSDEKYLIIHGHHLIKGSRILFLEKLLAFLKLINKIFEECLWGGGCFSLSFRLIAGYLTEK